MKKNSMAGHDYKKFLEIRAMETELFDTIEMFHEALVEDKATLYKRLDVLQKNYSKICL